MVNSNFSLGQTLKVNSSKPIQLEHENFSTHSLIFYALFSELKIVWELRDRVGDTKLGHFSKGIKP